MIAKIWAALMLAGSARFWAQVGAGVALSGLLMGYGLVIWLGPWPAGSASKQLDLLGQGQLIAGFLVLVALACITGTKVNFNASRQGLSANVDGDDEQPTTAPEPNK
jgi:hypothetical protein